MDWMEARDTLLRELVSYPRLGVVTDMDGTISPIAPKPWEAHVTPRNRELLAALHECISLVAVVSGRGVEDLRTQVGLPELTYVGNHGLERWEDEQVKVMPEAAAYRPALEAALREIEPLSVPGVWIEDKGATASIHYRQAPDPAKVRAALGTVIQQIAARHGLAFFEGRMIFELRPPVELHKGTAFRQLIEDYHLDAAVFLGDDTTDVDAMRVARALRASGDAYTLAVGVDVPGTPESVRETADVLVSGVSGVEAFLSWLLSACNASST